MSSLGLEVGLLSIKEGERGLSNMWPLSALTNPRDLRSQTMLVEVFSDIFNKNRWILTFYLTSKHD